MDDIRNEVPPRRRTADALVASWVARPRLDVLKLVAMESMLIDHLNTIWFAAEYVALRAIGRLAFPLFAFVLAYNFVRHTRHPARYICRLMLWGVVSQLFFQYAFDGDLLNIFFTLGSGLCVTALFRRTPALGTTLAVALLGVSTFHVPIAARLDFGIEGVLLVFVYAQVIERPSWWRAVLAIVFTALVNPRDDALLSTIYNFAAVTSLLVIAVSGKFPGEWHWMRRWGLAFYFFYPAHLFVLKTLAPR